MKSSYAKKGSVNAGAIQKNKPSKSRSAKAGLNFPVGRITNNIRKLNNEGSRLSAAAAVAMTAVVEFVVGESAVSSMKYLKGGAKRIAPRHISKGINKNPHLKAFWAKSYIMGGGFPLTLRFKNKKITKDKKVVQAFITPKDDDDDATFAKRDAFARGILDERKHIEDAKMGGVEGVAGEEEEEEEEEDEEEDEEDE